LKYWPSSRDFNKLVIKAKMHAKTFFFWSFLYCMKIWRDFFFFERLGRMHENKKKCFFWRKPGILIPDVYFYDVKIQINIKQNLVKNTRKSYKFSKIFFKNFFWTGLDPAHSFWIGPDKSEQWRVN
jgi:hypothetical protein